MKSLPSGTGHELTAVGVARLPVPAKFYLEQYQDIEQFKKAPEVLQIGRFSNPPRAEDLQTLTLEPSDVKSLRDCRTGKCSMKLSDEMMRLLQRGVDWSAADRSEQANQMMRTILAEYAANYLEYGNSYLLVYSDKKQPVRAMDQFLGILRGSTYFSEVAPEFYEHVERYPNGDVSSVSGFAYWSKEKFGLKPTITITHVLISNRVNDSQTWHFIAGKQIYASHYFEGSLGLTILVEDSSSAPDPSCWLIYFNRSRSDALHGWLSGLKRAIAAQRTRSGMQRHLARLRSDLTARFAQNQTQ